MDHESCLKWMEAGFREWRKRGYGWAIWDYDGPFGFVDSGHPDAEYIESFRWIPVRHTVDIRRPYSSPNVVGIKQDFRLFRKVTVVFGEPYRLEANPHARYTKEDLDAFAHQMMQSIYQLVGIDYVGGGIRKKKTT